jgi:hypothetical protein
MSKSLEQKIIDKDEQIKKLQNEQKQLRQKQRTEAEKVRKQRLYNRGGKIEKLLPHLADLTEEQFDIFVDKVLLSTQTKKMIDEISTATIIQPTTPQEVVSVQENEEVIEDETEE